MARAAAALVVLFAAAACSANDPSANGEADAKGPRRLYEDAAADGGDANEPPPPRDATADAGIPPDVGGETFPDASSMLLEAEGLDEQTNDDFASAEALPLGSTIHGTIGNLVAGAYDLDVYRFNANTGDVLRVTLTPEPATSTLQPHLTVLDEPTDYQRVADSGGAVATVTREMYVDFTGALAVAVSDLRNVDDPPGDVGGATFTYALTIERVTPAVQSISLPLTRDPRTIDENQTIQIFELTAGAGETLTAETFASRLDTPSDVDTILFLEDRATGMLLAAHDDIDLDNDITDSLIEAPLPSAGVYRIVLDWYAIYGADRSYELTIATNAAPGGGGLVLNEVDYDQVGADNAELVEIYNAGDTDVALAGVALIFVNGLNGTEYRRVALEDAGASLPARGYLVVAMDGVAVAPSALLIRDNTTTQNGAPDGLLLFDTATETVLDALSYEGAINAATITGAAATPDLVEGTATSAADSDTTDGALARCPDGADTNDADTDWAFLAGVTAGEANDCP
jgi:hypothetical protein